MESPEEEEAAAAALALALRSPRVGGFHKRLAARGGGATSEAPPLVDAEARAGEADGKRPPGALSSSSGSEELAAGAELAEGPPLPPHRRPPHRHPHSASSAASPPQRRRRRRGHRSSRLLLMDAAGGGGGAVLYSALGRDEEEAEEGDDDDDLDDEDDDDEPEDGGGGGGGGLGSSESAGSGFSVPGGPEPRKRARGTGSGGGLSGRASSSTSSLGARGGSGYEVVRELGPEEVRWFYREDRKSWKPFIGYDSLRIEVAYRALPLLDPPSPTGDAPGNPEDVAPPPDTLSPEPVCVRGGLYEVDVANAECYPVYWNQSEKIPVMRGQWFVDGTWQPLEEEESNLIEQEHLSCFKGQQMQENFDMEVSKPVDGKEGGAQQLPLDP